MDTDSTPLALKSARDASNAFATRLYLELAKEEPGRNLFFSPYSVETALAMAALGARNETAREMGEALSFPPSMRQQSEEVPWDSEAVLQGLSEITRGLQAADATATEALRAEIAELRGEYEAILSEANRLRDARDWDGHQQKTNEANALADKLNEVLAQVDQYEIRIANALWCEQTYPFQPTYLETIEGMDESLGLFAVDFIRDYEGARVRINQWTEEQTRERIKELIPDGVLDKLTRLVLTNAIYFKGEWAEPFDSKKTRDEPFLLAGGGSDSVELMQAREVEVARYAAFRGDGSCFDTPREINMGQTAGLYPDEDGFLAVELPYKGDQLSMLVVVPQKPDGLDGVERILSAQALDAWVAHLESRDVHVALPKFGMETSYKLKPPLASLGMVRAFVDPREANGADFSAMSQAKQRSEWLYVTAVLHKAFLEVNEQGTEAAAATAVAMAGVTSVPVTVPFTPTVRADRPFLFMIRDRETGVVLFLGRFVAPDA